MANHRMISNRLTSSATFLQMPLETQALYFHLCVNADDDGIIEAYSILKTLGTGEDSMRILVAKDFIYPLNQESVIYVVNWREHNTIRPDRLVKSIHRESLKKALPGIDLVEPKPRVDVDDNSRRIGGQSTDGLSQVKLSQVKLKNTASKRSFSEGKSLREILKDRSGGLGV